MNADSKLIISHFVAGRDGECAMMFMDDMTKRLATRVQLTTNGHKAYLDAVEGAFGCDVDFAQLVKIYCAAPGPVGRYSPAECTAAKKVPVEGNPDMAHVSTSYVERQNLTMRMHMRRFTRLTNAFSKKFENHAHMVALYAVWYNLVRAHKSLRVSPAMRPGSRIGCGAWKTWRPWWKRRMRSRGSEGRIVRIDLMLLRVEKLDADDNNQDLVRISRIYRGGIRIGTVCRISTRYKSTLVQVRSKNGTSRKCIYMDVLTRQKLGLSLGSIEYFDIEPVGIVNQFRWASRATDPVLSVPAKLALVSLGLGLLSVVLALAPLMPWHHWGRMVSKLLVHN